MKKHSKMLYLFLVVTLLLNLVLPGSMATASDEPVGPVITDQLITGVKIWDAKPLFDETDGTIRPQGNEIQNVRPSVKDTVAIVYDWSLPDDAHSYDDGSTYTFRLPDEFKVPSELTGKLIGEVGDYVVSTNGEVTFTFNGAIKGNQLSGNFYVWLTFDESKLDGSLEQPIDFSSVGQSAIDVHFANTAVDKLKKTAKANKNGINSDEIEWTVEFNQGEKEIKDAVLHDSFQYDGLALKGDITVQPLEVRLDGTVQPKGAPTTASSFPVSLGDIHQAYRVTYTTSVTAPTAAPFKNREMANSAELTGTGITPDSDIAKAYVNFNEPLTKSNPAESDYNAQTQTITWKIQYNYNEQSISQANAWIEDTFDAANKTKQKLVGGSVNVYSVDINGAGQGVNRTLVAPSKYTLTSVGTDFEGGFKLQFNDPINKAYIIEYQTDAKARIYKDETVANTVKMYDNTTRTGSKGIREVIFDKSVSKSDFQNKTIEWKLVLNQDSKEMTDVVIQDNYAGKHMKLDPATIKVNGADLEHSEFELVANSGDAGFESGFKLQLKDPANAIRIPYVITYTTSFDPTAGMPTNNEYKNVGTLDWNEAGVPQASITKSAVVTPQNYTLDNGNKIGEYNAKDKTITWKIDVNYNLHDIRDAVIKDNYEGNESFVENSLKVSKLTLDPKNNQVTDVGGEITFAPSQFTLNPDGKGFVLNLGNIGKTAYRITYKTSLDGEYPVEGTYSNHATLQDGEGTANLFDKKASVTPKHGGVYVEKTGNQVGQSDIASWHVSINPSQSFIPAGSIMTDTLSDNQILLKDSIKLYKADVPADNSGNVSQKDGSAIEFDPTSDYALEVTGNTFKLTFKKALNTAYILEYQSFINADSGARITNKAEFAGKSSSVIGQGNQEGILVSLAGAGGGASTGSGKIKIVKVDDLNKPLAGVKFELYNASGTTLLETLETDANGEAVTTRDYRYNNKTAGLPYKLKEVSVPSGYLMDPDYAGTTGKQILFKDPSESFTIVNKILRHGFELIKSDAADLAIKLQGAVFELRKAGTQDVVDTLTTDVDGKIAKGDLEPGTYELVEITAPDYYVLDSTPIPVTIDANQTQILHLNQTNARGADGKLILTKVDAKDPSVLLEGVEFELYDSTKTLKGTKTTDSQGLVEFDNLPYGEYTLVETKAAAGYVIEQAETPVQIKQSNTPMTIENKKNDRSVKLTKYNSVKSQALQGAVFELREETNIFDQAGNYVYNVVSGIDKAKLTTDVNGELFLENLAPQKYQLVEIQAPPGYQLDNKPVAFEITSKQTEPVMVEKTNNRASTPGGPSGPSTGPDQPGPVTPPTTDPQPPATPQPEPETPSVPGTVVEPGTPSVPDNGSTPVTPAEPGQPDGESDPGASGSGAPDAGNDQGLPGKGSASSPDSSGEGMKPDPASGGLLPKTGEDSHLPIQLAGFGLIVLGGAMLLYRKMNTIRNQ